MPIVSVPPHATVRPRATVAALQPFPTAEGRHDKLRLDLSEWTGATPEPVQRALRETPATTLTAYPEHGPLTRKMAAYLDVPSECVEPFAGSDAALRIIITAYFGPGDTAVVVAPSFPMYSFYLRLQEAAVRTVPLLAEPRFALDIAGIRNALLEGAKGLFVPCPENPTGSWTDPSTWSSLAAEFPDRLFVIDEAYADFAPGRILPRAPELPNVIATGSFSKALGLAGARIGWAVGHPDMMRVLAGVRSPYSVNGLAMRAACALMDAPDLIGERIALVAAGKQRLTSGLREFGIEVFEGHANAVIGFVGEERATPLTTALLERGILIRDVSRLPMLAGAVRIAAAPTEHIETLLEAMSEILTH